MKKAMISPLNYPDDLYRTMNHTLYTDVVYVRDFTQPDNMTAEQLKHLALIAHYCYQSYDLALKCIKDLESRSAVVAGSGRQYLSTLTKH